MDQDWTQLSGSREYDIELSGFTKAGKLLIIHSTTPLTRKLVVRIANYSDRLGPSDKHFVIVILLYRFRV